MKDIISEIYEGIASAKKSGKYYYDTKVQPSVKNKVITSLRKENLVIIEPIQNKLIFTWIGNPDWYKSTTGTTSYTKDKVMKLVIQEIIKLSDPLSNSIKLWNPNTIMELTATGKDKDKVFTCTNYQSVSNSIFPIISKYR